MKKRISILFLTHIVCIAQNIKLRSSLEQSNLRKEKDKRIHASPQRHQCKEHAQKKKSDRPRGMLRQHCLTSTSAGVAFTDPLPLRFPSQTRKYRPRTF